LERIPQKEFFFRLSDGGGACVGHPPQVSVKAET
jgi:hypothetical protein